MPTKINDSDPTNGAAPASRGELYVTMGMVFTAILIFPLPYFIKGNCPPDTILSGHMGRGHTYFLFLLVFGPLLIALWMATRPSAFDLGHWLMGIVPVAMIAAGLFLWAQASFSYFCATPDVIHLHPALAKNHDVGWGDVWRVVPECNFGRHSGPIPSVDLLFSSGDAAHVAGGSRAVQQDYPLIVRLLRDKPAKYNLSEAVNCGTWRSFFYEQLR